MSKVPNCPSCGQPLELVDVCSACDGEADRMEDLDCSECDGTGAEYACYICEE